MCGIFGIVLGEKSHFDRHLAQDTMDRLFQLSESRGKEASGVACLVTDTIHVAKHAIAASDFITRPEYVRIFQQAFPRKSDNDSRNRLGQAVGFIGHSRLVTNGGQQIHDNNQPVIAADMVVIHNGIITNADELWRRHLNLKRRHKIDTEVMVRLVRDSFEKQGDIVNAVREAFAEIEGAASVAIFFADLDCCIIATNNGSLYTVSDPSGETILFASESYILRRLKRCRYQRFLLNKAVIEHVASGTGRFVSLKTMAQKTFSLTATELAACPPALARNGSRKIVDASPKQTGAASVEHLPGEGPYVLCPSFVDEYPRNSQIVERLRRCARCVLPETMPFINFDSDGICNYCHGYNKINFLGLDALRDALEPHRKTNGEPDCLVTFSGGRDSSYGVHFVKTVLDMNPVTYTYDWGMVTDLARRNQMRICGKLGIEHILVSADIAKKRINIRKNVTAWLRTPDLGTVPLFMAGDKQYFYYANKIGKQTGCKIIILCENMLETTRFKSGFCGVAPDHGTANTYALTLGARFRMAMYYGRKSLANPAYLNSSLVDTFSAFFCYYFIPHPYLNLFRFIRWNEETISETLIREYNWEIASDTLNTWRIGDGTASFYNYIYYTMAGMTENDTFRSNQIREGMITRDEAIRLVERDNEPRYESIQWYCDIVGIDFYDTITTINGAPKLYSPS